MAAIWEMLEERMKRETSPEQKLQPWLTWQEFAKAEPWCVDPLLVNAEALRLGKACASGRGLRGSARALCRLLAADLVPRACIEQTLRPRRRLTVSCLEDWEALGCCLDVAAGWQLFRLARCGGGAAAAGEAAEVVGYGHADGATGSVCLRLPGASVAVLLTCVDAESRAAGRELLAVVLGQMGLRALWPEERPDVPERMPEDEAEAAAGGGRGGAAGKGTETQRSLERLEAQVSRLAEVLQRERVLEQSPRGESEAAWAVAPEPWEQALAGHWASAEVQGLEELFDAMGMPALHRALVKKVSRRLAFDVRGDSVSIHTTTMLAGRQVEDTKCSFQVGQAFESQQMGRSFRGCARLEDEAVPVRASGQLGAGARALVVEKRLELAGQEVTLVDRFQITPSGRLAWTMTLCGRGLVEVRVTTPQELKLLAGCVDRKTLRLTKEAQLGDVRVWRGGFFVGPADSVEALLRLTAPCMVRLRYDDLQGVMMFDKEGGPPRMGPPASAAPGMALELTLKPGAVGSGALASATGGRHKGSAHGNSKAAGESPRCCAGLRVAAQQARYFVGHLLRAAAAAVEGPQCEGPSKRHVGSPSRVPSGPTVSEGSKEPVAREALRPSIEDGLEEALRLTRQISGTNEEEA